MSAIKQASIARWIFQCCALFVVFLLLAGVILWGLKQEPLLVGAAQEGPQFEDTELVQQLLGHAAEEFSEIRCFVDTSIDETRHCRFRFSRLTDLQKVIDRYRLIRQKRMPSYFSSFGILGAQYPDWYDIRDIPNDSLVYETSPDEDRDILVWLYVDAQTRTAYLETMTQ